ncbi:MAG: hypothetical protein ACLRFE_04660 [Clostridia bacterium]
MLNFFETIIEYITLAFEWLSNAVQSLVMLVQTVLLALGVVYPVSSYLWAPLGACAIAVVAIAVLKVLIGRDSI